MDVDATPNGREPAAASQAAQETSGGALSVRDVERLTEKVYRLMLADIRLSMARGHALPRRGTVVG